MKIDTSNYLELSRQRGRNPALDKTVEVCPACSTEVEVAFDCTKPNFKQVCPVCNNRLMLCSECEPIYGCDFEWGEDGTGYCKFNPKGGG